MDADDTIVILKNQPGRLHQAYRFLYGIFNLEFIENLIPSFCFSESFNTLTVLCLDYCVALFPLLMIALVLLVFRAKDMCFSAKWKFSFIPKSSKRKARSMGESVLPAFASFLLLSYTKFSLVSLYIVTWNPLMDRFGASKTDHKFVYFAGQFEYNSKQYSPYFLAAIAVICTFVLIPPLILLDYPLRAVEWVVSKSRCLQRVYPVDKVHIFLDTFQGCYRNKMRFFAGLYFIFRLLINTSYGFNTWILQFLIKEIACLLMVTLIAICKPYERSFINYVDILIFTNLGIINGMSHYFYEAFMNHENYRPSLVLFSIQYCLIFLPLVYMLAYIVWIKTEAHHRSIKVFVWEKFLKCCMPSSYQYYTQLNPLVVNDACSSHEATSHGCVPPTRAATINSQSPPSPRDALDEFFARAEDKNTYHHKHVSVPATVVKMRDGGGGDGENEASVRQTFVFRPNSAEGSMLLAPSADGDTGSSSGSLYGATRDTADTAPLSGGSTARTDSGCQ